MPQEKSILTPPFPKGSLTHRDRIKSKAHSSFVQTKHPEYYQQRDTTPLPSIPKSTNGSPLTIDEDYLDHGDDEKRHRLHDDLNQDSCYHEDQQDGNQAAEHPYTLRDPGKWTRTEMEKKKLATEDKSPVKMPTRYSIFTRRTELLALLRELVEVRKGGFHFKDKDRTELIEINASTKAF